MFLNFKMFKTFEDWSQIFKKHYIKMFTYFWKSSKHLKKCLCILKYVPKLKMFVILFIYQRITKSVCFSRNVQSGHDINFGWFNIIIF